MQDNGERSGRVLSLPAWMENLALHREFHATNRGKYPVGLSRFHCPSDNSARGCPIWISSMAEANANADADIRSTHQQINFPGNEECTANNFPGENIYITL